jgi:DNA-binding response OmpR family regulator
MIKRILLLDGRYDIEEAENGLEALETLKGFNADLVILDLMMPGKDGYQTCRDMKQDFKGVKIIGMSGNIEAIGKIFVEEYGADYFFEKPFSSREFKNKLIEVLSSGS